MVHQEPRTKNTRLMRVQYTREGFNREGMICLVGLAQGKGNIEWTGRGRVQESITWRTLDSSGGLIMGCNCDQHCDHTFVHVVDKL